MMKKKLTNPFALILQGFVAGAILFWSSQPAQPDGAPAGISSSRSALPQIARM